MAEAEKSFLLRYVGTRFNGARLPVDVLSDLPAFRDLLVAFAKDEWRKQNSKKQRVPKGFDKSLSFDLVAIEDGSAVPKLNWNRQTAQSILPGFKDELEAIVDASFADVVELIDEAGQNRFPKSLSSEHIRALNKLGAGLRDHERIEFIATEGTDGNVIYLDSVRRKNLITRVRETYQSRFEGVGQLRGTSVDDDRGGHIVVFTDPHGEMYISLDQDRIVEEFDGNLFADVQFDLQIELDNNDKFRSVVDVFDVALIDAKIGSELVRCRNRLAELGELKDGWHDGAGTPISEAALATAGILLTKRPSLAEAYKIYPIEQGGVLFEFESNGWDLSVEIASDGTVEMYGVQLEGDDEMEPSAFANLDDAFMREFDDRTGRQ